MQIDDLLSLLSKKEYERFVRFEWKWTRDHITGMIECPNPDCSYYFEMETPGQTEFTCLLCKEKWCLECQAPFHEGYTCDQYKIKVVGNQFELVTETNKFKRIFRKYKR